MEGKKEDLTAAEKKAAIEEIDRQLAELDESPDKPDKQQNFITVKNGKCIPAKEFKPIRAVTAAELDKMDIPPIEWIVNKILPVGLSMIGAPSKYYKSYMALGLCIAICNGMKFLDFDCNLIWKVQKGDPKTDSIKFLVRMGKSLIICISLQEQMSWGVLETGLKNR